MILSKAAKAELFILGAFGYILGHNFSKNNLNFWNVHKKEMGDTLIKSASSAKDMKNGENPGAGAPVSGNSAKDMKKEGEIL